MEQIVSCCDDQAGSVWQRTVALLAVLLCNLQQWLLKNENVKCGLRRSQHPPRRKSLYAQKSDFSHHTTYKLVPEARMIFGYTSTENPKMNRS